ncbi:MAG: hypothetical protein LBQ09_10695 [Acidobacteriaceae bacterium]|nr:hypothetical protein [Acidobacteriaceae bacterium]
MSQVLPRRSFLSRLGAGAAAFGAAFTVRDAAAQSGTAAGATGDVLARRPDVPRHAQDDWMDHTAGKHRLFFDATTPEGFGHAIFWANNFLNASRDSYGLTDADAAVVIGIRHGAAAFALTDAIWAKYGEPLSTRSDGFLDPKSKIAPVRNVYLATDYGAALTNTGTTLTAVVGRGVHLAVCGLATRANAGAIARSTGAKIDDVLKELTENMVTNSVIVPAGIVAVNRAQERGYTFTYAN